VTAPEDALWYFAYGSNMTHSIFRGRRGMTPLASRHGWLHGYRLCFNIPVGPGERGVANVEVEAGARLCGVLYLLSAAECDRLDRTEGVHVGLYRRVPIDVLVDGEGRVAAFTYQSERTTLGRKPSARYMGLLIDGAREHELPAEYVEVLRAIELAVDERKPNEA
jgi:cation transport regulator ChaC